MYAFLYMYIYIQVVYNILFKIMLLRVEGKKKIANLHDLLTMLDQVQSN